MKYKVYFEIYGKKMVAEIDANAEWEAKEKIIQKIQFHKIEKIEDNDDNIFDAFRRFGLKI